MANEIPTLTVVWNAWVLVTISKEIESDYIEWFWKNPIRKCPSA